MLHPRATWRNNEIRNGLKYRGVLLSDYAKHNQIMNILLVLATCQNFNGYIFVATGFKNITQYNLA
jgi:hypothetical protein